MPFDTINIFNEHLCNPKTSHPTQKKALVLEKGYFKVLKPYYKKAEKIIFDTETFERLILSSLPVRKELTAWRHWTQ